MKFQYTLKALVFFLLIFSSQVTFSQQAQTRINISLDKDWDFVKVPDVKAAKEKQAHQRVNLPHTWNIEDSRDDEPGYYRGLGVYTKKIVLSQNWKDKAIYLCIDGADQQATVLVNGQRAGVHIGGYNGFRILISHLLNFEQLADNQITIQVDNHYNPDIPPLSADFTFFGGLYRHVHLLVTNPVHFADEQWGTDGIYIRTPQVSAAKADIAITGHFINPGALERKLKVITTIYDVKNQVVCERSIFITGRAHQQQVIFTQQIPDFEHPTLWSPEHPYRYRFRVQLRDEQNQLLDEVNQYFGFRWFSFDVQKGFYLNGQPCKLRGASRHQDFQGYGNAVPDSLQQKDMVLLKQMGANFLRIAHYPQSQLIMNACDSLGLLVSVEIPVVNQITESQAFSQCANQMQTEMIRQNFNHPAVIIWGYMNEVLLKLPFAHDQVRQEEYLQQVAHLARELEHTTHQEDSSRYTMIANHGNFNIYQRAGLLKIPQLIGWNLYQGWYGGKISDFAPYLDKLHKQQPNRPFLVTEFGADADPRIRSLTPERFDKSIAYALQYHQACVKAIEERPFVAGGAIWNLADFSSEPREETMPHINNKGLLTYNREKKDTYLFYKAHWSSTPYLKISNWQIRAGQAKHGAERLTQPVNIFTNVGEVRLLLDGKDLGTRTVTNQTAVFEVPFKDGANHLVAYATDHSCVDSLTVQFSLIPADLQKEGLKGHKLAILLGAKREFIDQNEQLIWLPDQNYVHGWGSIGGSPYHIPHSERQSYGTDRNIRGTDQDPVYQTQQVGIKAYQLDLPRGTYRLNLYFAEFQTDEQQESLVYNLGAIQHQAKAGQRVFDVSINGKTVLRHFNIAAQDGALTAVCRSFRVKVKGHKGICIRFSSREGQPVLNALKVQEIK